MKPRNGAIELFRCLMMFMIVAHHSYLYGIWADKTALGSILFYDLINFHVDAFLVISGWFGIVFSWRKFWKLWGIILFYRLVSIGYLIIFCHATLSIKEISVSGGWFGPTYMMLLLLMPLVNAGIEALYAQSRKSLLWAWWTFAFGMIICWAPCRVVFGLMPSGYGDRMLLTLLFVYFTARCARLCEFDKISLGRWLWMPAVFLIIVFCAPLLGNFHRACTGFNAPQVVGMALWLFIAFLRLKVSDFVSNVIVKVSPFMFDVFLFHEATSFGRSLIRGVERLLADWEPCCGVVVTALIVMFCGIVIGGFRHMICLIIGKMITRVAKGGRL